MYIILTNISLSLYQHSVFYSVASNNVCATFEISSKYNNILVIHNIFLYVVAVVKRRTYITSTGATAVKMCTIVYEGLNITRSQK